MRRLGLLFVVLTLAACNALRDAFSAQPQVAGTAAGQALTVERLAGLAGEAKQVPLRPPTLTGLTTVWLDYAVLAVDLAGGRNLDDSALVLAANWPNVAQRRWEHFHERLVTERATLSRDQTDSAFRAGDVRLFQHILIRVAPSAPATDERQKQRQAEGLLRQVAAQPGGNFARLANRFSDDPGSKTRGGYLPAGARGGFVPAFDTVAWALAPGAMSGVVRSPFGFHIIRRPPLEEVRDSFQANLETTLAQRLDSAYIDSLARGRDLKVASGAPALVRQIFQQVAAATEDNRKVATYRGGAVRVRNIARWLFALDARDVNGLSMATDAQLNEFVRRLAQRDLLLLQVDSAGVQLTPDDWREIKTGHDSVVSILRNLLGLSPQLFKDSAAGEPARVQLAMAHVDGYLDRALKQGTAQFFPVPPFFALALRPGRQWSINQAGVALALERAQQVRARADSASGGVRTGLRPAPGPPPVPPDTASR